jgi:DNA-binding response OmpR family regulator
MESPLVILSVEDDDDILFIIACSLCLDPDIVVHSAPSAEHALRMLNEADKRIACVLLDVHMPKTGGEELLTALRKLDAHRHTPVILLTASLYPAEIAEYKKLDVVGVISKPFNPLTLAHRVRALIDGNSI